MRSSVHLFAGYVFLLVLCLTLQYGPQQVVVAQRTSPIAVVNSHPTTAAMTNRVHHRAGEEFIQVGLVVETALGNILRCVNISLSKHPEPTGYTVLELSGIKDINTVEGDAICAINGTGCHYPEESCFCQCQSGIVSQNHFSRQHREGQLRQLAATRALVGGAGAGCTYWAYFHLDVKNTWEYSKVGPNQYFVKNGMVEGWKWSGLDDPAPRVYKFDDICRTN